MQIKDKEEKDKEYEGKNKILCYYDFLVIVTLIDTRDRHFDRY
jgi:hypothetical protein